MACSYCGYSGAYGARSCPNCNPVAAPKYSAEDAQRDRKAGYELGHAVVTGLFWLLNNRYLSYVWFWLAWIIASYVIGQRLGFVSKGWEDTSFGFDVFGAILPIIIAIVFRKHIPEIMRWVWLALIVAIAGLVVLNFVSDKEPARQANPVTQAEPSSAAQVEAARKALNEAANSEITFTAPGSDDAPSESFEGVDLRFCEIGEVPELCQRYCATLEVNDRPGWCN